MEFLSGKEKMTKYFSKRNILILVLVFTALSRLIRLDFPHAYVFDEVYHAFTAKEYLKGSKAAWDPWAKPPPGVAYEWTHPPLAKEFMTVSMFITGSTEGWAWRLPGALLGVLSVYLIYLLGKSFFKNEDIGILAAFLFSIDGLNFVQSRTGMNDIYLVTFCLASLLFFIRKNFLISAVFIGLAIASKWTGLYLLGVLFLLLLYCRKIQYLLLFLIIPPLVYLASYIPYFLIDYNWDQFIILQKQMWGYHTGLKATHDYASLWWSWPFNLVPVWFYVEYPVGKIANIFTSGNLLIFLFGLVAIITTALEAIQKRSVQLGIIILCYLAFIVPWILSPRIAFLYHYSPCVPFLCLALSYQLYKLFKLKEYRKVFWAILFLIFLNFVILYPFITGIPLPKETVNLFFQTNIAKNPF
jgi:dolichyl-phosphate-mannose-protein mannosyltransferase